MSSFPRRRFANRVAKDVPSNATAEAWFAEQRWPDGKPFYPHCGNGDVQIGAAHASQRYRCRHRECGRRFSVKVGTVMEGSNIKLQKWAIAIYLIVGSGFV